MAEYFNLNTKDMRVAHARGDISLSFTLDQSSVHAFCHADKNRLRTNEIKIRFRNPHVSSLVSELSSASLTLFYMRIDFVVRLVLHQDARVYVKTRRPRLHDDGFYRLDEYREAYVGGLAFGSCAWKKCCFCAYKQNSNVSQFSPEKDCLE